MPTKSSKTQETSSAGKATASKAAATKSASDEKDLRIRDLTAKLKALSKEHNRLIDRYNSVNIDNKDQQILDLSGQLQDAKDDYNRVFSKFHEAYHSDGFFFGTPMSFTNGGDKTLRKNLSSDCRDIFIYWAQTYALNDIKDMEALPDTDKKYIMASLQGYCVQEDIETLVPRFPESVRQNAPEIFMSMYIIKDMMQRFYTNPFWYLGPNPGAAVEDVEATAKQKEFTESLWGIGREFREANRSMYDLWKATTCRLANVDRQGRGKNHQFGRSTKAYREALIGPMVSSILASKTVQLLLKEPKKIKPSDESHKELLNIYKRVAEDAVDLSFHDRDPEIETLNTIEGIFDHKSKAVTAADDHFLLKGDCRLDGKPILGIMIPGVLSRNLERAWKADFKKWLNSAWILKAHVLVEEPGPAPDPDVIHVPVKRD
ncbi:hypothetical protein BJY00DRAFT_285970 [Aspergillus carlsbadensis]|nr:hypothetical protein BJY00DRAFT_285970 [Aspergillus carlsbadensis]